MNSVTFKQSQTSFNLLSNSSKSRVFNNFTKALQFIAGENIPDFIEYLFNTNFGKNNFIPIAQKLLCEPIVSNVITLYKATPASKKPSILSLIACHFNKTQLLNMDLDVSQNQIQRARDINRSNKATLHEYERTMPESKRKIEISKIEEIIKTCLKYSQISSYSSKKTKEISGLQVEGYDFETNYILNTTKENIFQSYNLSGSQNLVSRSTFFRYIPSNFINPKKKTDMCPICHA